ncbi:unnamed protein product [Closterium sp. NIES-64]|nr:unnamed protein product [Closterium sp. NIES-65]CAI5985189.1 unnamed protein product [Closterium sp. NIES-64]
MCLTCHSPVSSCPPCLPHRPCMWRHQRGAQRHAAHRRPVVSAAQCPPPLLPTHSSPFIPPHSFLSLHSSPLIPLPSFLPTHSSPFIPPHSFLSLHSSPLISLPSFLPTHSSPFIPPHSFLSLHSSSLILSTPLTHHSHSSASLSPGVLHSFSCVCNASPPCCPRLPIPLLAAPLRPCPCMHGSGAGFDFAIRTPVTPPRWKQFDAELTAAWRVSDWGWVRGVGEGGGGRGCVRGVGEGGGCGEWVRGVGAGRWYQLMPLTRGSAMVGLIAVLGLSMAAGMLTTAPIPHAMQVDWEAILVPHFAAFNASVAPWLYAPATVLAAPSHLPLVAHVLPSTRHVIAALNHQG